MRVHQVERIEVEGQPRQQRDRPDRQQSGDRQNLLATPQQKRVEAGQYLETDGMRLRPQTQQRHQGRQQGQAEEHRDQHADAGDDPQLGHAAIGGRQKRQEAGTGGNRRQHQRRPDEAPGAGKGAGEIVLPVALRAIADGELDAEIDCDADEQNRKRDRNQVERADRERGEGGGAEQTHDQRRHDRQRHPDGAERAIEQQRHQRDGDDHRQAEALTDGGELLVVQRHVAGQLDRDPVGRREPDILGRLADEIGRVLARRQRLEIEDRLDLDETLNIGRRRLAAGQHRLPRHRPQRHVRVEIGRERVADPLQRGGQRGSVGVAALNPFKRQRKRIRQTAQAGVGGDIADESLGLDHRIGQALHIRDRQQQQPVLVEERPAVGPRNAGEQGRRRQLCGERSRRAFRLLWR